jgi:acetoacetyl-CoA synthetase
VVDESIPVSKLPRWFEGIRLNWTENMLWNRSASDAPGTRTTVNKEDDKVAAIEVREGNSSSSKITWGQLRTRVGELAAVLKARGVKQGDRVVMVGSHSIQTLVVFLATTWLGAIFSSSSTDMGVGGLLQRTLQVDPKVRRQRHAFLFFVLSSNMSERPEL